MFFLVIWSITRIWHLKSCVNYLSDHLSARMNSKWQHSINPKVCPFIPHNWLVSRDFNHPYSVTIAAWTAVHPQQTTIIGRVIAAEAELWHTGYGLHCHVGVSENSVPLNPMVFMIIIPMKNGYFIGKINPTFSGPNPYKYGFPWDFHGISKHFHGISILYTMFLHHLSCENQREVNQWPCLACPSSSVTCLDSAFSCCLHRHSNHGSLVMSPLNIIHITQPWSVYGLLDGYYKVMSNIPKSWDINPNPWQTWFVIRTLNVSIQTRNCSSKDSFLWSSKTIQNRMVPPNVMWTLVNKNPMNTSSLYLP